MMHLEIFLLAIFYPGAKAYFANSWPLKAGHICSAWLFSLKAHHLKRQQLFNFLFGAMPNGTRPSLIVVLKSFWPALLSKVTTNVSKTIVAVCQILVSCLCEKNVQGFCGMNLKLKVYKLFWQNLWLTDLRKALFIWLCILLWKTMLFNHSPHSLFIPKRFVAVSIANSEATNAKLTFSCGESCICRVESRKSMKISDRWHYRFRSQTDERTFLAKSTQTQYETFHGNSRATKIQNQKKSLTYVASLQLQTTRNNMLDTLYLPISKVSV